MPIPNARHAIAQMRHREKKKFVRRGQACCRASCLPDTDTNRTPDGGAHQAEPRGRDGLDEALCALQDRPSAQQAAPRTCLGTSTSVVGSPHLFARSARRRSRDRLRRVDESGSQAVTQARPFAPASHPCRSRNDLVKSQSERADVPSLRTGYKDPISCSPLVGRQAAPVETNFYLGESCGRSVTN